MPWWNGNRAAVMVDLLRAKFSLCEPFRRELYRSGENSVLAHTNKFNSDPFWTTKMTKDKTLACSPDSFEGKNTLGKLLMRLREDNWHRLVVEFGATDPTTLPPTHAPADGRSSNQPCSRCGVPGHSVAKCRYKRPLNCHGCRGIGHKLRYCPNRGRPVSGSTLNQDQNTKIDIVPNNTSLLSNMLTRNRMSLHNHNIPRFKFVAARAPAAPAAEGGEGGAATNTQAAGEDSQPPPSQQGDFSL
jgi:hypothetical protein